MSTTFKSLAMGKKFRFPNKAGYSSAELGICTKVSVRKYTSELTPHTYTVGTIGVEVEPVAAVETIDMTPSWRGVLPMLLLVIENGTGEGRKMAVEELQRMADLADAYVAEHKGDAK